MKIRVLSDLHMEFAPFDPPPANADVVVLDGSAALWIHGHTHHCVHYHLGGTRVLSNQRGYPDEGVRGFDPELVIDL